MPYAVEVNMFIYGFIDSKIATLVLSATSAPEAVFKNRAFEPCCKIDARRNK